MNISPPLPAPPVPADPLWTATDRGPMPSQAEVGGKGYNLARLARMAPTIPYFFVLRADALSRLLGGGALPETEEETARLRERAERMPLPDAMRAALREALEAMGDGPLAVRSSAVGEDGERSSFAGQFETVLGVAADVDEVWSAVRRVWASAFHPRAEAYRRERGEGAGAMAVVVQHLLEPEAAGVAFSVDPVSGDGATAVVSAVHGLGEGLVSGALDADTYYVRTAPGGAATVEARVARKPHALRFDAAAGEVRRQEVAPALRDRPVLTDDEARAIAEVTRALAADLGAEQDVEWALAPGPEGARQLYLLQTRPITTLGEARPGTLRVWDNEGLVESLPGITLPLTYSVARRAFGQLYMGHCLALGTPEREVAGSQAAFDDILGLVRGRAYDDTAALRRVMLMVPNTELRDGLAVPKAEPEAPAEDSPPPPLSADLLFAARGVVPDHVLHATARLDDELADFRRRVREVLDPLAAADFGRATPDELRRHYERLDRGLLAHWRGPMLNDSLIPHWTGLLRYLIKGWIPGAAPGAVANQLVAGGSDLVSAQPVLLLASLAGRARDDARLHALLTGDAGAAEVWEALHADPAFAETASGLREFLARFGDRCPDELKLEAASYTDSPEALVEALRACAAAGGDVPAGIGEELRARTEEGARKRLAPEHVAPFFAVLEQARRVVRERENTRFERTRAFGVIRRLFRAMGARLAGAGALADPGDVFYLTTDELFAWLDGHSATGDLRPLVPVRRAEFDAYRLLPEPPHRFATRGPPALSALEPCARPGPPPPASPDGTLRGTGCCPGVVRARVRVVRDPRQPGELAGRILVAEQTDPGWTLLFPAAAGVLVERGSVLSHAALVARELGVPCVVGIPGLLGALRDGEVVEMNGMSGIVRRVPAEEADAS